MSRGNNFIIFTFVFVALIVNQVFGRKIYAYLVALECPYFDPDYAETVKCWVEPDRNGQYMMNANFKLKRDLTNLRSKFQLVVEQNNKNMTYLSLDIDVCEGLGAAMKNPILRLTADELRRKSNLPLGCPLLKGIEYYLHNFTINTKLIPPFAPRLRWISDSIFYTNSSNKMEKLLQFINVGRIDHVKPKMLTPV